MTQVLAASGYTLLTAADGIEALAKARSSHPSLIVLDIVMPGMDGFQTVRLLARDHDLGKIPVMIYSNKGQEADRAWALRQGARDYLVKPAEPAALLNKVARLLGRH